MTHNEHLFRADQSYELFVDDNGNALHILIKDGIASIFQSLQDFISYNYFHNNEVNRICVEEKHLDLIYRIYNGNFDNIIDLIIYQKLEK